MRIPNTDPDPEEQNQGGSMRIRIRNTVKKERKRALGLNIKHFKILLKTVSAFLF
jgi:hypothetical protein